MKGDQGRERKKTKKTKENKDSVDEGKNDAAAAAAAPEEQADADAGAPDRTFHRYYHLYRKGELEEDVAAAGGVVLDSGYERDNWWAIAARSPS
ncbi:tRNA (uracil-5-)-methyltransferase TRM9 [Magnaporthiopsis poae ATCC 64411]|uniref:tRNA (Uracil-5-)-methyltransferase TRM9 n=1 Tax=Magnaporthiopsis poae (strain ATCC 64411 / 73-15) TaxID=644358 RepID=A0A0C4E7Z0_MAGP6|nr:tRNA (uracil-5-)-methyltransferase TRM9 [Magnaporthiopsis poae ATCC 64411]